jgi:hypothetical protein
MPASATRLWTSNFLSISFIISSRPMNFASLSNGTVKSTVCGRDGRSDEVVDPKSIRLKTFKYKGNRNPKLFETARQTHNAYTIANTKVLFEGI